ncbi:peptidogalycan biosysnthesis protein [Streptomyces sp. TLI_185]|uniref:peptidogalycan biosysnthesis protein n=1 Tax=Streptomyces sp. TLI_185 TaxID=2485151 RepID=UPI000F4E3F5C|nr:peptidogalycan biosysnthesis protein [Streptomyces sp. TLI_185]RPF35114.1 peptidoglycan biosynthesis/recognition protein [Streptomyces sp. TLI_185]
MTVTEYATADELPGTYWTADPADPRSALAWLTANRWPEDGVRFLEIPGAGAACAVRTQDDHSGFPRMNCTDVAAGTGRDVAQPEEDIEEARTEGLRQLNVCALGYGQSVFPARDAKFDADTLLTDLEAYAHTQGRLLTFLHLDEDAPVVPFLRERGWSVGVTDRYFHIVDVGPDETAYLAGFSAHRRRRLRRELASLEEAGASAEIHRGDEVTALIQQEVARLEACSDDKHGIPGDRARLLRMNERLRHAFGPRYCVALVRDRHGTAVASATALLGTRDVLPRMVGLGPGSKEIGAYFHVAYHLMARLARDSGGRGVLLSTGTATAKLHRGATARPLLSAVPPAARAHTALLRRTDAAFAAREAS